MTMFDLADVLERRAQKSYGTLGEAFEDLVADALSFAREDGKKLPDDLAEVDVLWTDDEGGA
jgi:hypothetical protein